jgi:hypothetical protein
MLEGRPMGIEPRTPNLPVTAAAVSRAIEWLIEAWDTREATEFAIDALALARVCGLLNPGALQASDRVSLAIARGPAPVWGRASLLPSLIAAAAAVRANGLTQDAMEYLRLLGELQDEANGANGALLRLALHGTESITNTPKEASDTALDFGLLRSGKRDDVARLLATIETATLFGRVQRPFAEPLSALLDGAVIAAFRAYDLPLAMRLLRARLYVQRSRSLGVATGFDFVRLSQCPDGSFGDFETALARMAARGDPNGELRLKLPITLQALWTMAEIEDPSFRLLYVVFARTDGPSPHGGWHDADGRSDRGVQA